MSTTSCKRRTDRVSDLYMDTAEAAIRLGVLPRRIIAMIHAGQLPAVRRGVRGWAIERAAVEVMATRPRRRAGRPRKDVQALPHAAVEVALTRDAVRTARDAALRGVPFTAAGGALLSPQLVAYVAGLVDGGAKPAIYTPDDGVAVVVEAGGVRVRLAASPATGGGAGRAAIEF